MVMAHFAPILPHITALGLLASTHTNTALSLLSQCVFGLVLLKSLSHTSDTLFDRPYLKVKNAKLILILILPPLFQLTGRTICDVQEIRQATVWE